MRLWELQISESLALEGYKLIGLQLCQLIPFILLVSEIDDLSVTAEVLGPSHKLAPLFNLLGGCRHK